MFFSRRLGRHPNWKFSRINIPVCVSMLIVHLMTLIAGIGLFTGDFYTHSSLAIAGGLAVITGFSITLCYHRLLTHGSFKTYRWVRLLLTFVTTLSWEGGPITWIGTHRIHHKYSDAEGDPHTPGHGFDWAHMGWLLVRTPEGCNPWDFTKDLQQDPWMLRIHKYFWAPQVVLTILLFSLGCYLSDWRLGTSWVLWAIGVRTTLVFHWTWLINSAAHTYGYRNFDTPDGSRNLPFWLGLLTLGEGYHNNHHAQQRSAAHGMKWYEIDLTYMLIKLMEKVGLAWNVVEPKPPS